MNKIPFITNLLVEKGNAKYDLLNMKNSLWTCPDHGVSKVFLKRRQHSRIWNDNDSPKADIIPIVPGTGSNCLCFVCVDSDQTNENFLFQNLWNTQTKQVSYKTLKEVFINKISADAQHRLLHRQSSLLEIYYEHQTNL